MGACTPLTLLMLLTLTCMASLARGDNITVGGTGSGTPVMELLAQDFAQRRPQTHIQVLPAIGSGGAYRGVHKGSLDIGISGRLPTSAEHDPNMKISELARTPFVFVVAQAHPLNQLSTAEVAEIYAGTRTTWADGGRLRLIMRPRDDTVTLLLKSQFPAAIREAVALAETRPGLQIAATDLDSAELLEQTPGAFGALTLGQIGLERRALKALALDGVVPSVDAARTGRYPYYQPLYLLLASDAKPLAREFHAYLHSVQARELLGTQGFWFEPNTNLP